MHSSGCCLALTSHLRISIIYDKLTYLVSDASSHFVSTYETHLKELCDGPQHGTLTSYLRMSLINRGKQTWHLLITSHFLPAYESHRRGRVDTAPSPASHFTGTHESYQQTCTKFSRLHCGSVTYHRYADYTALCGTVTKSLPLPTRYLCQLRCEPSSIFMTTYSSHTGGGESPTVYFVFKVLCLTLIRIAKSDLVDYLGCVYVSVQS